MNILQKISRRASVLARQCEGNLPRELWDKKPLNYIFIEAVGTYIASKKPTLTEKNYMCFKLHLEFHYEHAPFIFTALPSAERILIREHLEKQDGRLPCFPDCSLIRHEPSWITRAQEAYVEYSSIKTRDMTDGECRVFDENFLCKNENHLHLSRIIAPGSYCPPKEDSFELFSSADSAQDLKDYFHFLSFQEK